MARDHIDNREILMVRRVEDVLRRLGFQVEREMALSGGLRPDLTARSPDRAVYVIEIKSGSRDHFLPFAAVAQVSAYRKALQEKMGGVEVHPVISSSGSISPAVREVSRETDVILVDLGNNGSEFFENLKRAMIDSRVPLPAEVQQAKASDFADIA